MKGETTMLDIVLGNCFAKSRVLNASVQRVGDVVLIRPKGRVSTDGGDAALRNLVLQTLNRGDRRILLNLKAVSLIDYSGIAELVAAAGAAKKRGAVVRLCCLSVKACSLFQRVQLLEVFDVREDEEDGLGAFVPAAVSEAAA
jgi:anti-sigma B factor antagonist